MADASRTIRTRFDGDASGLVRAAKSGERAIDNFGRNAGKSFVQRFKAFFTGENDPSTFGSNFGKLFGSGIVRGLAVPGFGPQVAAVLIGAVAALAPVVGGLLATGIIGGLGAGLVGLGVFFASKFQVVETAWSEAIGRMGESMQMLVGPFAPVLANIAEMVENTFNTFFPTLKQVFDDLAPAVEEFTGHLLAAFQELEPAIQPVSDAFIALMESLGPELPGIMEGIANGIINIAEVISNNPDAFAAFFVGAGKVIEGALLLVATFAESWSQMFNSITTGAAGLPGVFAAIVGGFLSFGSSVLSVMAQVTDTISTTFARLLQLAGSAASALGQEGLANTLFGLAGDLSAFNEEAQTAFGGAQNAIAGFEETVANMPKEIALKADHSDLMAKLEDAKARLAVAPKEHQVEIKGEVSGLERAINIARIQLAGLQGKTVYIDVITRRSTHINAGLRQHGGPVYGGQTYLVGEAGPELLFMPGGAAAGQVTPMKDANATGAGDMARQLSRAVAAGINGATLIIDDHGRGRLVSRTADLYARAG